MRERIYKTIDVFEEDDNLSKAYDFFMMATIVISLIPLFFRENNIWFIWMERVTTVIFILDYILRLITADFKLKKKGWSFLIYPITPMALIDLISILPSIIVLNKGFRILKVVRLIRTFRVFRVFKGLRYSKSIQLIIRVFKAQRKSLMAVFFFALGYIIVSALIMFNIEPETFKTFWDALYWATISLTTVGYGDIYAVSEIGKLFTAFDAILGVAFIALPSGIISAGFVAELGKNKSDDE